MLIRCLLLKTVFIRPTITEKESTDKLEIPEKLKKLHGVAKIPLSLDDKKEIRKILSSKE